MDDGEMYLGWSWIMPSYRKFPKYHNPQAATLLYEGRTGCFVWRIDGRTWQKQTNYEGGNKTKVSRYARAEQNRAQQDTSSTCSHSSQVLEGAHQLGSVKSSKVKILAIAAGEPRRHVARHISAARTRDTWHIAQLFCHNIAQNISNFYDKWDDVNIKILPPLGFSSEVTLSSLP